MQVGNTWWTTLVGVWHGSGYTRTVKSTPGLTLPWIVPELWAHVEPAGEGPFELPCTPLDAIGGFGAIEYAFYNHEVSVGETEIVFIFGPWGIGSWHYAAGRYANYCHGKWYWS